MSNSKHSIFYVAITLLVFGCTTNCSADKIDREKLVLRHIVHVNSIDSLSSLSTGNGKFAFTVDFTGLQSFPDLYEKGIPLGSLSEWGWHIFPNKEAYRYEESLENYNFHDRVVPYAVQGRTKGRNQDAANYLRQNPHRLHLGIVGLDFLNKDGSPIEAKEISSINQTLNPWNGEIHSSFQIRGIPVEVTTYVHQDLDMVSSKISSPLIEKGLIRIKLDFPYPTGNPTDSGCNWNQPEKHNSSLTKSVNTALIRRDIDTTSYIVRIEWKGAAKIAEHQKHSFYLQPDKGQHAFSFSCLFAQKVTTAKLPDFDATTLNNQLRWKDFWLSSGIVDFSGSTDLRAAELERRVILSQYLTKIQSSGSYPPQETGLVYNSWYGKFHLEMHYWHSAHFANWNHPDYLDKQLEWYRTIYYKALETAKIQGFKGVRWPKMVGPEGQNSPSDVGSFLIWQQPHVIYMAEQLYTNNPTSKILNKYKELVFATADFMADFAVPDSAGKVYNLLPPLIPAQEHWNRTTTMNPPFELAYWHWGLTIAQKWRRRLNLPEDTKWENVRKRLAVPVQENGVYLGVANAHDSYTNPKNMTDHPMVTGMVGILPIWDKIDPVVMRNTLEMVMQKWNWPSTWGWDYPMVAMCATRLNEPEIALEALLKNVQKNTYLKNGYNYQNARLSIYLPGNGGLLKAIALMCAGWEGCKKENPGFPKNGKWQVKWENLSKDF